MAAWHPFADEALGALAAAGDRPRGGAAPVPARVADHHRIVAEPAGARAAHQAAAIEIAAIKRYPDADGYVRAVVERVEEAIATLPAEHRATAPVLFSAHGLPEAYIKRGDPYLDDMRITVETVTRRLGSARAPASASRAASDRSAGWARRPKRCSTSWPAARTPAVVVVPIAFTGEHIETLQEIDILYKERAQQAGIVHFARARTVGCHPAFIAALADLVEATAHARGWA